MTHPVVTGDNTVADFASASGAALTVAIDEPFIVHSRDRFAGLTRGEPLDRSDVVRLVGPVFVKGIEPGQLVAVTVHDISPATGLGYLLGSPGYGIFKDQVETRVRTVDVTATSVHLTDDLTLDAKPMIGKLGLRAADDSTGQPFGPHGGALSSTSIAPGATVLLRAAHAGGGLCLEDVHARMGDAEATASAVEMPARVTLSVSPWEGDASGLPLPAVLSDAEVEVLASGATLDEATLEASRLLAGMLATRRDVDLTEAALLIGAAGDLRISFVGARPVIVRAAIDRRLARI
ncbi:MAG: hypothetical protein AAF458_07265 [Pseudomonadota bacterium]